MPGLDVVQVAVDAPLPGWFDYLPPPGQSALNLAPGVLVWVPFGHGRRLGLVVGVGSGEPAPERELRAIEAVIDPHPIWCQQDLALLRWAAGYYHHPPGEVLLGLLPQGLREGRIRGSAPVEGWRLTPAGAGLPAGQPARAPRQRALLELLGAHPAGLGRAALGDHAAALRGLRERGWVEPCLLEETAAAPLAGGPPLNEAQRHAVDAVLDALGDYRAFLLDGVTGSGKTEVYLSLIEAVLARNGQVLVLVPEIGLTPQLQRRLARRIGAPVALLHSGRPEGERERDWWLARDGRAGVVLGTRSALFTPMPRLALILVDEEHDLSFKQQDGFRYNARDLAVRRAHQRGCPVVLGSATPSLETLRNAGQGRYQWLHLPERAGGARPPRLDRIDLRSARLRGGLAPALIQLLSATLDAGQQALLFLNRRGFAPLLTCHDCGWVAGCPSCDARLTLHQEDALLWCHHCGYRHRLPSACPACRRLDLRALGQGTERLEQTLAELFPGVPAARVDRDSTRRRGSLERLLEDARAGRYPLLLGTQMLAKGHHFPGVTLVGILDLDQGLYGADYRAAERMAQLIVQVAGRAGRADKPGRVALQTRHPDHPLLQTLLQQGYGAFAALALEERQAAGLPPFSAQALLRAEANDAQLSRAFLDQALAAAGALPDGIQCWGPVPAPMERRAGRYRAHLLVQAQERPRLQAFLGTWVTGLYRLKEGRKVRWSLDVDPQEVL